MRVQRSFNKKNSTDLIKSWMTPLKIWLRMLISIGLLPPTLKVAPPAAEVALEALWAILILLLAPASKMAAAPTPGPERGKKRTEPWLRISEEGLTWLVALQESKVDHTFCTKIKNQASKTPILKLAAFLIRAMGSWLSLASQTNKISSAVP